MDRNWYTNNNGGYPHQQQQQQQQSSRSPSSTTMPPSDAQDAHGLLAGYPMASATPSTHVARHMNSLTLAQTTPSYMQPQFYSMQGSSYPQGNPPPYTEYATELNYLAAPNRERNDSGYWEGSRNDATRLLDMQAGQSSSPYPQADHWARPPTNHPPNSFAQSIFQRHAPASAYPTPPPPGITTSSSSLAFALGLPEPPPTPVPAPPPPSHAIYRPQQSHQFFRTFIEQKSREANARISPQSSSSAPRPITPTKVIVQPKMDDSPDPLALGFAGTAPSVDAASTPRKRQSTEQLHSPSTKRLQSNPPLPNLPLQTPPRSRVMSTHSTSKSGTQRMAYVQVPPRPSYMTPTSARRPRNDDDEDDLGGYGSDDGVIFKPMSSTLKSSGRRTGDRDDRAPLEKLTALIEDIFEAEDALPADSAASELPIEWFSPLTQDTGYPLLHPSVVRKLTKYVGQVARPAKRLWSASAGSPAKGKGRVAEIEAAVLSRLLKILDRSVRTGEDLDPFAVARGGGVTTTTKKTKKGGKAKASQSQGDGIAEPPSEPMEMEEEQKEVTEADLDALSRLLETARDSVLAADSCIAILGSDRLPKQLYSEELITVCLSTIKNQLEKIVYPFVESSSDIAHAPPLLQHLLRPSASRDHRSLLRETFQALSAVLPRITNLVSAELVVMSDSIIIQAVYIAIGPFFVVETGGDEGKGKKESAIISTLGNSAMRGLRLDALSLIRSIFANHEDQRSWIIEEILSSLIKLSDTKQKAGQYRLRDGKSIRTVSALLLQLVQTSAHGVRISARRIRKARQQQFALRRQESLNEKELSQPALLDEQDKEEIRLYGSGLESANKAARTIILFLTQRSGKGKATKSSNEAEYRAIFDHLISDLLAVLYWPEWPAASLLLSVASFSMVQSLDDVKTNNQTDNNAAKSIALDHLGVIAARIRSSSLKVRRQAGDDAAKATLLKPLDEILEGTGLKEFDKLLAAHGEVASHLSKRSSEDQAYDSARELSAVTWGQEIASALSKINSLVTDPDGESPDTMVDRRKLTPFGEKLKAALQDVWNDQSVDVFDVGSQEEAARVDQVAEEIGTVQSLRSSFMPILNVILSALDAPPVFMRTKALRALGQIVTSDPSILATANVQNSIERRLLDSSPAVRDAAVELIGKYMIDSPEVAGDYYSRIADRICDTGLGVRKRVIKLLKSFYSVTNDTNRHIDISTRMVQRMGDEDDTVKDLAIKTVEELWFQGPSLQGSTVRSKPSSSGNDDKSALLANVTVIMGVSAHFKDRQSPLEDLLHKIMASKEGPEAATLHTKYSNICDALIDGLVDASDLPGFTVVSCVRTIYLFSSAYPAILSGTAASTLLPYLKNATTPEEQNTSDYLLKIFRITVPHMPKTAVKFGSDLQHALQPMILKPSGANAVAALQEIVACICAVVQSLTHDFKRLVVLLQSCNNRLRDALTKPTKQMTANDVKALSILIFIASLLVQHCDFDRLRTTHEAYKTDLDSVSKDSITEHIYMSLLHLYNKFDIPALRSRVMQCLGFLFRAQPTLMTLEGSTAIMDSIFESPAEDGRGRMLRILQEFLVSEAAKHSAREKEIHKSSTNGTVNMEELVGNTDGFADSGVSSAVVQRYFDPILKSALSQNPQIQAAAVDILTFTVKQGLVHPLQSFPAIVALETSPSPMLSGKASALHAILHNKHASLLNSRFVVSAKASFEYQQQVTEDVKGYRLQPIPIALMQRWYSHVREKRTTRQDFLKALVKVFDVPTGLKVTQEGVNFTRYMAENFSAFDYKTMEEALMVVKYLTSVLSTAGMQLVEVLSPAHLLKQLHAPSQSGVDGGDAVLANGDATVSVLPSDVTVDTMRSSVSLAMILLLKAHLKGLYGISEDKVSKFVPGKKSNVGDRAAQRRHERPISWDRLPFATAPLLTTEDMVNQKIRFLELWNEDGVTAEPEDVEFE